MLRSLALSIALSALPAVAFACDMATEARADNVADYVENGEECLIDLPDGFRFSEQMELAFIRLINEERVSRGLQPLVRRVDMRPAARFHSLDMGVNGFFGHESPKGRTSGFRISAFDRTMLAQSSAENVAKFEMGWTCRDGSGAVIPCGNMLDGQPDPMRDAVARLHQDLMDSPGHRANILSPKSTHISVGVARTDTGVYVTQLFAQPVGEFAEPVPVRLGAGQAIEAAVELDGLDFKRFALMDGGAVDDLFDPSLPEDVGGDFELSVRGEQTSVRTEGGSTYRATSFIYLPGPAITVETVDPEDPSTGS